MVQRAEIFTKNFNVGFYALSTTFLIVFGLVSFYIAEYTRLIDGLSSIFPDKPYFILVIVSVGMLVVYTVSVSLTTIQKANENFEEYVVRHTFRSRIGSLMRKLFGKPNTVLVTSTTKIMSRKSLLEAGIVFISISGNLLYILNEIFEGENIPVSESFSYIVNNITFNDMIELSLVMLFSVVIIFNIEPLVEYVIKSAVDYLNTASETQLNEIITKYKQLGYKTLDVLKLEKRIDLTQLEAINNNYTLLFKLFKKDNNIFISVADIENDREFSGEYNNQNREKTIRIIEAKLKESV